MNAQQAIDAFDASFDLALDAFKLALGNLPGFALPSTGGGGATGFDVERLVRLYQAPWLWRLMRVYLAQPLHRMLGVDFAGSILAVGRKAAP